MKVIVDTSIWIEYLKNNHEIAPGLDEGLLAGNIYMVGPVVSELLQGAKTENDYQSLSDTIDGVPFINAEFADWQLAGKLSFKMKKKGVTIAITDCVIAAIAINNGAAVYTLDQDFQSIPDVPLYNNFGTQ